MLWAATLLAVMNLGRANVKYQRSMVQRWFARVFLLSIRAVSISC